MSKITTDINEDLLIKWLFKNINTSMTLNSNPIESKLVYLECCDKNILFTYTKVFVNGKIIGLCNNPLLFKKIFLMARRCNYIPLYISFNFSTKDNYIYIFSDEGRLTRPIFYFDDNKEHKISYLNRDKKIQNNLFKNIFSWNQCLYGFRKLMNKSFKDLDEFVYNKECINQNGIIEYMDKNEEENTYISMFNNNITKEYTHCEIHPCMIFGVMGSQVLFPEHNQLPRNLFSCGQSKQAVSYYHSNFNYRIDKSGLLLNYGENPIVKSRIFKYLHNEEQSYGFNTIVAIMSYDSYNVEDSILFNEGSIKRGMFHNTYYNMYETYEETSEIGSTHKNSRIKNLKDEELIDTKPGYDYNFLNDFGLIEENTLVDDSKVLIGKVGYSDLNINEKIDESIFPKKGQYGFVDKVYVTDDKEGQRIAKVRIREQRIPNIGDKFCSRCGQKGTIGRIIPECDMPFTKDGLRPDIIINPHAIPSRMTIGQLVEMIMTKIGLKLGYYMDCTPFTTDSKKIDKIGELLMQNGMHRTGNEYLYNGYTGEMIEHSIFVGPSYYMRLKHMPKDKINYRSKGPRCLLTRQTNHGRANDGGLRIGEMERDGIISHGCSEFLKESMMERGDKFKMTICNNSGTIAVYDKINNQYFSPLIDGPIDSEIKGKEITNIKKITKYSKDFSVVNVPYCFKLLMQELSSMNIQMRLITEESINKKVIFKNNETKNEIVEVFNANSTGVEEETLDENSEEKTEEKLKNYSGGNRKYILPNNIKAWNSFNDPEYENTIYYSTILDENGDPTEILEVKDDKCPKYYPKGWDFDIIKQNDLPYSIISESLNINDIPNNWKLIIDELLKRKKIGIPLLNSINFKKSDNWNEQPIQENTVIADKNMVVNQPWIIKKSTEMPDYYYFFNTNTNESRWTIPSDFINQNTVMPIEINNRDLNIQNMNFQNVNNQNMNNQNMNNQNMNNQNMNNSDMNNQIMNNANINNQNMNNQNVNNENKNEEKISNLSDLKNNNELIIKKI